MTYVPRCDHCGRFTTAPDGYAPWGGAADQEPPDEVLLCARCARVEYDEALESALTRGIGPYAHRPWWLEPSAWMRARAVARSLWRRGLAARPVVHARARDETTGRGESFRVREWCCCGWSTPSLSPRDGQVDYLLTGRLLREHIEDSRTAAA